MRTSDDETLRATVERVAAEWWYTHLCDLGDAALTELTDALVAALAEREGEPVQLLREAYEVLEMHATDASGFINNDDVIEMREKINAFFQAGKGAR